MKQGLGAGTSTPSVGVQAIHAVTTTGAQNIYAQVNISESDVWVRCHVKWLSDLPVSGGNVSGAFASVDDVNGLGFAAGVGVLSAAGTPKVYTFYSNNGPFATVTTGVWYLVDLHFAVSNPRTEDLWIDDVDQNALPISAATDPATGVEFGIVYPGSWETNYALYLANLKIGTTRGASDIWTTALTNFSDFDFTDAGDGTLEIVTVPGP